MSKAELIGIEKADDNEKTDQTSAVEKDTNRSRRINIQMVQNVILIWLDQNIDENNDDCQNTITQLHQVINTVNKFTDSEQCVQFIHTVENEKICMIISGSLGAYVVPRIHDMSQVDSIFIFCANKKRHERWAIEWSKVKGVFTDVSAICQALKQAANQCEQNATPISFMGTANDMAEKNLNQLDCSFMYTQIMKEILLTIRFDEDHIQQFIQHCQEAFIDNEGQLHNVEELGKKYHDKSAVCWYTCQGFLYPMLNRALRLMDVDVIIKMGFFIRDLHRQLEKLHEEQFDDGLTKENLILYRGQGLSKNDFEQMSKIKGGLMSFNNFLSTTTNRDISISFANYSLCHPDMVGIVFVMNIDPSQSTTPFASIKKESEFADENEVLFSMHSVFRVDDIKPYDDDKRLFQVDLTLSNDDDKDLHALSERIQEEIHSDAKGWYRLGKLLLKLGRFDKAQEVYEILLDQTTNDIDKATCYHHIGWAKWAKGEYEEALTFYSKALKIRQKSLSPNHIDLAKSYNSIGNVYYNMRQYSEALLSYDNALEIRQQSLARNHPDFAKSYNNMGLVYKNMGEYSKALSYYEKALKINQQSLPPNHPDLAKSYNNIGNVYLNMGRCSKALEYYEKDLEISQQSLPPNHPDLATSYNNVGCVYEKMWEYSKARSFYERALNIAQQSLPSNHPNLEKWRNNLDSIQKKL